MIYQELVEIRKELQAIRSDLELEKFVPEDSFGKHSSEEKSKPFQG